MLYFARWRKKEAIIINDDDDVNDDDNIKFDVFAYDSNDFMKYERNQRMKIQNKFKYLQFGTID